MEGKMDCIFCQIVAGELPSQTLYQDEEVMAFRDIKPLTSTHVLIIPKKHIPDLVHLTEVDAPIMGHMVNIANQLAKKEGVSQDGYRLVINCGDDAGQIVSHLHMHLLGGRRLTDGFA
jgi:histidine triad (HIT) family protein